MIVSSPGGCAVKALLVERPFRNRQVGGSIPSGGSRFRLTVGASPMLWVELLLSSPCSGRDRPRGGCCVRW